MAIIVGDIHSDLSIARAFLDYRPSEMHVALGDLVDARTKVPLEKERACLELLLQSDTVLLWGNHDLAYLPERSWKSYGWHGEMAFRDLYDSHRDRFQAAYSVDGWLLTHAGLCNSIAKTIPGDIKKRGAEAIAGWLESEFQRQLSTPCPTDPSRHGYGPLFNIAVARGGINEFGGILWYDADAERSQLADDVGRQIYGHTPVWEPRGNSYIFRDGKPVHGPEWINLCTIDSALIYDTELDKFIDPLHK